MNCRKRKQGLEPKFCWFGKENLIHLSKNAFMNLKSREIASESNICVKNPLRGFTIHFVMYFSDRMWEMILQKVDLPTSCFLFLQLNCRFNCRFFLQLDCRFRNPEKNYDRSQCLKRFRKENFTFKITWQTQKITNFILKKVFKLNYYNLNHNKKDYFIMI